MLLSDFDYHLPPDLIAQHPLEPRDSSRLLVLDRKTGDVVHTRFRALTDYLRPGDTLVFNDTRVIPARLVGKRADTGGKVEVFLLNRKRKDEWEVLVKPGKKARPGCQISFSADFSCEIEEITDFGGRIARFKYEGGFEELLEKNGQTPLPPYIKEQLADKERYQTVYAREKGSAAAPTAGLHFTPRLMKELQARGVKMAFITLHVGLGTFRPVTVTDITKHVMHKEYYSISPAAADLINTGRKQGRIVAVGTTTVRTLESSGPGGRVNAQTGWTDIFIYPGYQFKMVDAIITNFHLPKSSLLMLISAFAGRERVLAAYDQAVAERYRFFSFGDAMFIV